MWADNETEIDLLGFDFLVDELLVLLTEPRLLPVTVGIAGDWGSGKSSLLAMTAIRLKAEKGDRVIVVRFNPWQYEDYDDVKSALMKAVVSSLTAAVEAHKTRLDRAREGRFPPPRFGDARKPPGDLRGGPARPESRGRAP
ncbi:MAG: P-loop NTPase fold protein [Candidatus Limnocylindrales bacterium]